MTSMLVRTSRRQRVIFTGLLEKAIQGATRRVLDYF